MRSTTYRLLLRATAATAMALLLLISGAGAAKDRPRLPQPLDYMLFGEAARVPDYFVGPPAPPSHIDAADVRDALDLSASDVVSISFGTSDHDGFDVFDTAASYFPEEGLSYFVMSTGATASALLPNDSESTSTELDGLNTTEGEDLVQIVLVLQPPAGATCLAFDFAFYSEEFPEFVGSEFNDAFIAEVGQSTFQIVDDQVIAPNNFAFDTENNVITINTVFGVTAEQAADTTYDAATPLLTAVTPLENPGQQITITLSIMDLGDSIYDSTAFIDNMRWFFGLDCTPGADADSDGDALLDDWETNGIDFDNDGDIDLDLAAMGADPQHKDLFIEIDYMVEPGATGHSHKPKADALQILIDTFENAPLSNPDGDDGIHIHIDAGSDTIMNPVTGELWGSMTGSDALAHETDLGTGLYNWTEFDAIKGVGVPGNFNVERADVFHYCIFAHDLSPTLGSTSGISRGIPSSDFIVSLGGWTTSVGTVNEQAGTLMHELGHNLNLRHGGSDHDNYKPNYLSVMNYFFQTSGLRLNGFDGNFDYSRFMLPSLIESSLDETAGLAGVAAAANYGTRYYDAGGTRRIVNDINGPIDWNGDGDATDNPVAVDVNGSGGLTTLTNSDNWDEIVFDGGAVGHLGEMVELPEVTDSIEIVDIDAEENGLIPQDFTVCIAGPGVVTLEACETATYAYTISNTGDSADMYEISVTATQAWADTTGLPPFLVLAAGQSVTYNVPIEIPEGTPDGMVDDLVITATSLANSLVLDAAETTTTAMSDDLDGDGLTDLCDACPDSDLGDTIVIDGCDSGVPNMLFEDGCTMADLIDECNAGARHHGQFVSCVAQLTNEWRAEGLITGRQKAAIQRCAARATPPYLTD